MPEEGKYLYCIIKGDEVRNFGPRGIGQRGDMVSTISYNGISTVISNTSMTKYVINRENLMAHEKVIEEVMKEHTVLPVRFCTIAPSAEELRNMMRRRHSELKGLLRDMDNKVEMSLKVIWKDIKQIFQEISEENKDVNRLKKKTANKSEPFDNVAEIALGKAVKYAMDTKREGESWRIVNKFRRISMDIKENDVIGDSMLLNAAFLIDRTREKEFDYMVEDLSKKYEDRVIFKYVGPAPPFNFVNLEVSW